MALKLGELVAYLKTDDSQLKRGLKEGERDFRSTGKTMERDASVSASAMAAALAAGGAAGGDLFVRGVDGRLRDARGRFVRAGEQLGDGVSEGASRGGATAALGFLGRFGAKFSGMLPNVVGGAFSGMPPQVQGAVAAAAVAVGVVFAAAAGAAISAGILLALGGGVLALGIAQAVKDPQVAAAWKTFGDRAKQSLSGFTDAFKGPVTRAAGTFGDAMKRMEPTFTRIGQTMAPIIDKLAPAFADMAEKAMPGIERALIASKPLFEKLAEHAPKIGEAVSKFFDRMAAAAPGATMFLDHFLTVVEWLIVHIGDILLGLSKVYEATVKIGRAAKDWIVEKWNQVVEWFKKLPGRVGKATSGMWNGLKTSFKSALNWLIGKWNNFSLTLGGGSVLGMGIPSVTLNTPNIPMLAKGGTALTAGSAIVGERGPELLHMNRGATVQPLPSGGGHAEMRLSGEFRVRGSDLVLVLRDRVAINGGNVQTVIGTSN